jgi:hypothetical protein
MKVDDTASLLPLSRETKKKKFLQLYFEERKSTLRGLSRQASGKRSVYGNVG